MGKLKRFEIVFDKPGGVYYPGENVTGMVMLEVKEELKMREIRARCNGYAFVHWKEHRTERRQGGGTRRRTVHYRSSETYFNIKHSLSDTAPGDIILGPDLYRYPFSFTLPHGIPTSYEARIGRVRYFIQVTIDRPWAFDDHCRATFTVANLLDLNTRPDLLNGASVTDQKVMCCLCCASDPIIASLTIDRQGFVPGEAIVFNSDIDNQSDRMMSCSKARLIMEVRYHARGKTKIVKNCIHELQRGQIEGGSKDHWSNQKLFIPPVPPSYLQGCHIIDIRYFVFITVDPSGIGFDLDVPLEVVIGSIPFTRIAQQYGEVITQQPTAPPQAPDGLYDSSKTGEAPGVAMPNLPPSAYAESAFGSVKVTEDDDNEHTQGNLNFAPVYTYYKWEQKDPASNFTVKLDEDSSSGSDSD